MDGYPALARARNLLQLRRYDAALEALVPALGDSATESEAWCLRTQALLGKGDVTAALPAARRAVAVDPGSEWPHRLLALVLMRGGNHKDALRAAVEAARIAPHQVETLHVLAICQANARKKKEALSTSYTLLERHPHSALALQTAGTLATMRRDWADAERYFRESLRLEPNDADVAARLAEVLKRLGRRQEAGEMLLAAARADPTNHRIRRSVGRLGLPVAAFGGFGLLKVVVSLQLVRALGHLHPATGVVLVAAFFLLVGGYLSYARFTGTRGLPEHVHRGLLADHRNYALGWLGSAGLACVPLAVWAAAVPPEQGRSYALSIGVALFGSGALLATAMLWTGPFPNLFPSTTAWLARRRASRDG
jgi:tetratricopeptide (TPR) repeat protein